MKQTNHYAAKLFRLIAVNVELIEALEIIAGERQCVDNLMSNEDIARAALAAAKESK